MNVNITDPSQILSHVVLKNTNVVEEVAETPEWKKLGEIQGTLTFNGVEVSAQVLEDALKHVFSRIETYYAEEYDADAFDARVEEKAKELLKEHAGNPLQQLHELVGRLEGIDDVLVPHWERK